MRRSDFAKPRSSFSKTRHSFATDSKHPTTIGHTTPSHGQSSHLKTRSSLKPDKRRSHAHAHPHRLSQPYLTPKRSRAMTATVQTTIDDRFRDIIDDSPVKNIEIRDRLRSHQQSKLSIEKSEDGQAVDQTLVEMEQETKYHRKFMEIITKKFVHRFPEKKQKLRELCGREKFYTENAYQPNNKKVPDYLDYNSSFYSKSRRRCYQEISAWDLMQQKRKNSEIKQRQCFSFLQYVADLKAKKKFQAHAKTKITYDCTWLMKSKEKILGFWKNGTNGKDKIKDLIDQILREKKL